MLSPDGAQSLEIFEFVLMCSDGYSQIICHVYIYTTMYPFTNHGCEGMHVLVLIHKDLWRRALGWIGFIFRVNCFQGSTLAFLVASRHGERLSYKETG